MKIKIKKVLQNDKCYKKADNIWHIGNKIAWRRQTKQGKKKRKTTILEDIPEINLK